MALVDVAGAGQLRATWADIDNTFLVDDKIDATECAIGAPTCPTLGCAV